MGKKQKQIFSIRILGFILMIGLMVLLNARQENAKSKAGKQPTKIIVANVDPSGLTPGTATIPVRTEGALPLQLISKTNSNFLLIINNCQQSLHGVKYQVLQKRFLRIRPKIHLNFVTEFLATIRNKDYR